MAWQRKDTDLTSQCIDLVTQEYSAFSSGSFDMLSIHYNFMEATRRITHWGRVTHICVNKLTSIGSDNGLSPDRRQTIIWTNAGIVLIGSLRTNFSEFFIEIHAFSVKKIHLKISSAKWRPFCLGLNVIIMSGSDNDWAGGEQTPSHYLNQW